MLIRLGEGRVYCLGCFVTSFVAGSDCYNSYSEPGRPNPKDPNRPRYILWSMHKILHDALHMPQFLCFCCMGTCKTSSTHGVYVRQGPHLVALMCMDLLDRQARGLHFPTQVPQILYRPYTLSWLARRG